MPKEFTLIVPPIIETELTGFILGAERKRYGDLLRVELHKSMCKALVNNEVINIQDAGRHAKPLLDMFKDVVTFYKQSQVLKA